MNSKFQQTLKQLSFKTFYHNQVATFGYDDLFADQRTIVFSLTNFRTICSGNQLDGFMQNYDRFRELGIDKICVVDSTDWLIGPMMDKRETEIIGLPDRDMLFVRTVADHYEYAKETFDLARFWQYVIIINNGQPEYLWHNAFKSDAQLSVLKDQAYRYRKISSDVVLKYLVDKAK